MWSLVEHVLHWSRDSRQAIRRLRGASVLHARPRLEALEDRTVPAHLIISSPLAGSASYSFTDGSGQTQQGQFSVTASGLQQEIGEGLISLYANSAENDPQQTAAPINEVIRIGAFNNGADGSVSVDATITWKLVADPGDVANAKVQVDIWASAGGTGPLGESTFSVTINGVAVDLNPFHSLPIGSTITVALTANAAFGQGIGPEVLAFVPEDQLVVAHEPPADVLAGDPFSVQVTAKTPGGKIDTKFNGPATIALASGSGTSPMSVHPFTTGPLGGTVTANFKNGVATFPKLTLSDTGDVDKLQVTSGSLNATTTPIDVQDPNLAVTTPYNQNAAGSKVFGTYLPGVNLMTPFTITAGNDPQHDIASVKWAIQGGKPGSGTASKSGTDKWSFSTNVGSITAGDHPLTVTAYNAAGTSLGTYTGTIHVSKLPLGLDLQGAYAGSSSTEVADLRFLRTIAEQETFSGTIDALPDYYKNSTVQVLLNGAQVGSLTLQSVGGGLGFRFKKDGGTLPSGHTPVSVLVGSIPIANLSTNAITPQVIFALDIPTWLKTGKASFQAGTYDFSHAKPAVVQLSVPALATDIKWLDNQLKNLTTGASLNPDLDVTIPLTLKQDPKLIVNTVTASAQVLGLTVFQKPYSSSDVTVSMKLDPQTLEPNDLSIALSHPQDLGKVTFLNKKFTVPILPQLTPAVTITASLALQLTGDFTLNGAGLELTWAGSHLEWVPAGTFIDVTASATGQATGSATASVLGGWLGKYTASATVKATLAITGEATLGGPIASPHLVSKQLIGVLKDGSYDYSLSGTPEETKKSETETNAPAGTFGPVTLFEL